jgi:hypothetical protein
VAHMRQHGKTHRVLVSTAFTEKADLRAAFQHLAALFANGGFATRHEYLQIRCCAHRRLNFHFTSVPKGKAL